MIGDTISTASAALLSEAVPFVWSCRNRTSLFERMVLPHRSSRLETHALFVPRPRKPHRRGIRSRGVIKASEARLASTETRRLMVEHVVGLEDHRLPTNEISFFANMEAARPSSCMA